MEKRRIFAWVLLIGFILLLLNLIVFRFYWQLSMVVYLVIVFAFLLTNGKLVNMDGKNTTYDSQNRIEDEGESSGEYVDGDAASENGNGSEKDNTKEK